MHNTSALLLCPFEDFHYSKVDLQKLIEREQTIHTQWQLDLADDWNSAVQKTKGGHGAEHLHGSRVSEQKPCRYLAVEYLPHAIEGVIALLNKLEARTATKDKQNIQLLSRLPWLEFTAIAFTNMIDSAIKRDNVATVIERIAGACEVEARWRHYATYAESLYDRILKQQRQSGTNVEFITKVLTVAMDRLARGEYGDSGKHPELEWINWPKGKDSFSRWLGATYMEIIIVTTGLFETRNDTFQRNTIKRLYTSPTFDKFIEETQNRIGLYGGYYLPLPVPPRDWTTTQCGGFWTRYAGQKKLIKNWGKGYQEEMLNHTDELSETVFPAINAAQHTAWRINWRVYEVLKEMSEWKKPLAGLPAADDLPLPPCPKCGKEVKADHECFRERDKDGKNKWLSDWKAEAADVHHENVSLQSRRLNLRYTLDVARILEGDERFYYVYQTDFRGRLYPLGRLHPQGADWQKALLEFADGVELGEHGAKWLAVHVANTWGNDKVSYEERVQWVHDNEQIILACAENPLDCLEWTNADEPFCFLAACFEWAGYKKEGNSHKSHCAVALDGSCSGIQHYSAMLRDEVGAIATNVKCLDPQAGKHDIYMEVAKAAVSLIEKDIAAGGDDGKHAAYILGHKLIERKTVKRAVMTLPYGSKFSSCSEYVAADLLPKLAALGMNDRSEKRVVCGYVAKKVWEAIPMVVEKAREGMGYLQKLASLFAKRQVPITWKTPTGFYVQQSYYSVEGRRIQLFTGGSIVMKNNIPTWQGGKQKLDLSFQSTNDRVIDPTRQVNGIAPNFVHSLDASHLMFSVKKAREQGIADYALIHDSLGTHAGRTEEFSKIIRDCFHDLYAYNDPLGDITDHLLGQLPDDLAKKAPAKPSEGDLDLEEIKNAVYLFA